MSNLSATPVATGNDEITRQLAQIWQELLGVETIGFDQNYFDLGGDSSLAVQLFARIDKIFHVKLPLATLFEAPTVEEMARLLQQQETAAEAPAAWSPLVTIQAGGTRPAFFCIHGAGGNVLIYRDLAKHMGPEQPFYGLQAQGLDGQSVPLTTIEEMAELYAKEIRKVQAHGPYYIGGYCMGGTLAYEVARRLQVAGEPIALLALFDTMDWSSVSLPTLPGKAYHEMERLLFHAANFFRLNGEGRGKFFREKLEALRNRLPVWRGMLQAKFAKKRETADAPSLVLGHIWLLNDRACAKYRPEPFAGVVTDFRPMKQYRMFRRANMNFGRLARGGERVVVLPVYPAGMLVEPYVKYLADALKASIEQAMLGEKA